MPLPPAHPETPLSDGPVRLFDALEPASVQSSKGSLPPLVAALTDTEIARAYLDRNEFAPHTRRAAQKEVGRFLLYCRDILGRSLCELTDDDVFGYKQALANPPAQLVNPRRVPRHLVQRNPDTAGEIRSPNPVWRPFTGSLSDVSRRQAIITVRAFLNYTVRAGYLARSPATLLKDVKTTQQARIERFIDAEAVELVLATIAARPASRERERDRFVLQLLWATGARLDEIVSAMMGSVLDDRGRWWLQVLGKGRKIRRLPIGAPVLSALSAYRLAFGLSPLPVPGETTSLILSTRRMDPVGIRHGALYLLVKRAFHVAAVKATAMGKVALAAQLAHASTHWLRHAMLTHHANAGVPLKMLQDTAGHASMATTARYLHVDDLDRHAALTGQALDTALP